MENLKASNPIRNVNMKSNLEIRRIESKTSKDVTTSCEEGYLRFIIDNNLLLEEGGFSKVYLASGLFWYQERLMNEMETLHETLSEIGF
ncbi:2419_t:CDS:2 [Funneliformis mosseae]|uniref:2419_t:CDS:1 n=1 Tax=Funneliformis mosseae TaxID=27381 RepID=A0A9N8VNW7_FUNMO|nr:2419_t:CDS:2 [Funneliformis mosseae]